MKADLGPEYINAEDLLVDGEWKQFALTIKEVLPRNTVKCADGKVIDKQIVVFKETDKRLVLGKTNKRLLTFAIGTNKEAGCVGKKITIYPSMGDWFGQKNVVAVRVRLPEGGAKPFLQAKNLGVDLTGRKQ